MLPPEYIKGCDARYNYHFKIKIIYCKNDYIIVDKPANLRIDGDTSLSPTLESVLYPHFPNVPKLYLCHQLDYVTSGVMVFATNSKACGVVGKMFQERTTVKAYLAVVKGHVKLDR